MASVPAQDLSPFAPVTLITPELRRAYINAAIGTIVVTALAVLAVFLRFGIRFVQRQAILGCDYLCLLSLFMLSANSGLMMRLVHATGLFNDLEPGAALRVKDVQMSLKFSYASEILFTSIITTVKLSILWFYYVLFGIQRFSRLLLHAASIICIIWFLLVGPIIIFQCRPVHAFWTELENGPKCLDSQRFLFGYELSNFFLDVMVLCIPITAIGQLKLSTARKLSVSSIFLLGAFVCIASIVRVTMIWDPKNPEIPMDSAGMLLWSSVQLGAAIICCCLPTFGPLLSLISRTSSRLYNSYGLRYGPDNALTTDKQAPAETDIHRPRPWIPLGDIDSAHPPAQPLASQNHHAVHTW